MTTSRRPLASVTDWVEARSFPAAIMIATLLGLVVTAADIATGSEISFSIFYLVPIAITSWRCGRTAALTAAVVAAAAWYTAELIGDREYSQALIPVWNGVVRFGLFALIGVLLVHLRDSIREASIDARIDVLAGVLNRRGFMERAALELARSARSQLPVTVMCFDIDRFKQLNDSAGHSAGDEVIRTVGSIARELLRQVDVVGRLGGDEFAALFPDTTIELARPIVERVHRRLEQLTAASGVTYSFGVVCFDPPPRGVAFALEAADAAMYTIKAGGGDGVRYERTTDPAD